MNYKFIYCTDENEKDKLQKKYELLNEKIINNKKTWIFENDDKIKFNSNSSNITFSNKMFI